MSIEEVIRTAEAVERLFDLPNQKYDSRPIDVQQFIAESRELYASLSNSQQRTVSGIAERVSQAMQIMDYLRERFHGGRDKEGLYKLVFGEDAPNRLYAKILRYHIEFGLPGPFFPSLSYSGNSYRAEEGLGVMLLDNIGRILSGQELTKLRYLSTRLNLATKKLFDDLKLPSNRETRPHERKHVIDNLILDGTFFPLVELSAALYSFAAYSNPFSIERAVKVDENPLIRRANGRRQSYEHFSQLKAPQVVIDDQFRLKMQAEEELRAFGRSVELMGQICRQGFSPRTLSYVVSLTPFDRLPETLEGIAGYTQAKTPLSLSKSAKEF